MKQIWRGTSFEERVLGRIDRSKGDQACHPWTGPINKTRNGYGQCYYDGKSWRAHIAAWFVINGEMPKSMLMHSCNNPICCNIKHLSEGSAQKNMAQMVEDGRSMFGSKHHLARYTEVQVKEMRRLFSEGLGRADILKIYGGHKPTINHILAGRTWKYIKEGDMGA